MPQVAGLGRLEREFEKGDIQVAGVDEVGRGCLAGPVYAACVALDFVRLRQLDENTRSLVRDSKQLTAARRRHMVPIIEGICRDWKIGIATVAEIEQLGILQATFLAMRRALAECQATFDLLLVDGHLEISGYDAPQLPIIKGDSLCFSIAAASILAKEARDSYMHEQARHYPAYGFDAHVGYGTKQHLAMIGEHGICPLHRRNFAPIRSALGVHEEPAFVRAKPRVAGRKPRSGSTRTPGMDDPRA